MNEQLRKPIMRMTGRLRFAARRGGLFRKYVLLFLVVVCIALLTNAALESWFFYEQHQANLVRIQQEQAKAAAASIGEFVKEVEDQLDWTNHHVWITDRASQRQLELWRLALHRIPAVSDLTLLDASGHEQVSVSRFDLDRVNSQIDFSTRAEFVAVATKKVYHSPVYFRRESGPYMTIAMAGPRPDLGVRIAEVNLRYVWDVVSQIKVGERGQAYVVSEGGHVIAHTDIGVVLRNLDLSHLDQVQAALAGSGKASDHVQLVKDLQGRPVLAASAPIEPLGWRILTELPLNEARAPLYAALARAAGSLLFGLGLALLAGLFLARRMMVPIRTLREGAAQISRGRLDHRVVVTTGDEFEELADQFNQMAIRLQESYSDLEGKVYKRTRELMAASQRIASQEAMRATQSNLARITRLVTMGEMAASIAHEINQPLAGIVANANASLRWLAGASPNLDEARAALKQIINAGHHAADVIGSIRAMFRKGAQERAPVDINKLIHEVIELVHGELEKHRISVQVQLNQRLPLVTVDRVQLQQVILNLVMNAIDAMDSITDRPRLLQVKSDIQAGDGVLVSVADSGTGIDRKDADRIFESFFTTKPQGTGMGLAICRSVIEAHGGRLWVSAGVPHGSVFQFALPIESSGGKS
jgi:two-component system NtrC family sensor kinase